MEDTRNVPAGTAPGVEVLWQDETAVVVCKPSGLLVHNSAWSGPREPSLRTLLTTAIGGRPVPVNRLDRGASGIVLFARAPEHARAWQESWQAPSARKGYLALVRGHLREPVTVDHPIRDRRAGGSREGIRAARSQVEPVACAPAERCSLVRIWLLTGRRHQARRHLKHLSHPILGDTTWGKGDVNRHFRAAYHLHRLALHAHEVHLTHPHTGAPLRWCAPLPDDLATVLAALFPGASLPGCAPAAGGAQAGGTPKPDPGRD